MRFRAFALSSAVPIPYERLPMVRKILAIALLALALAHPAATIAAPNPTIPTAQVGDRAQSHEPPHLFAGKHDPRMTGSAIPYRGRYFRASQLTFAQCVHLRESSLHWHSTSRLYAGGFQFSAALARGASYMIRPELISIYGAKLGRAISRELRAHQMSRWLPIWQTMAFFTVLNWNHPGSGAHHWAGGRWTCSL